MSRDRKTTVFLLTCIILTARLQAMSPEQQSCSNPPIVRASQRGDEETVRQLISKTNVNTADQWGWTALMLASRHGCVNIATDLLHANAGVDLVNTFGGSALTEAAKNGKKLVVRVLITFGAKVDATDNRGFTPLMHASRYGYIDTAQLLLQAGADLNYSNALGDSALTEAAKLTLLQTSFPCQDTTKKIQEYAVRLQNEKNKKEQLVREFILRGARTPSNQQMRQRGSSPSMIGFVEHNKEEWEKKRTNIVRRFFNLQDVSLPSVIEDLILEMEG